MKGGYIMKALDAIFSRRSIRRYTKENIPEEQVEILLKAAMAAPNTIGKNDWAFIVVRNKDILHKIKDNQDGNAEMLDHAPVAIVVCGDLNLARDDFWIQDCSAATQNILLAATSLGIGSVWLGTYPRMHRVQGLQNILNIPKHIIPLSVIALGYPDEVKQKKDNYEPEKVHYDSWK